MSTEQVKTVGDDQAYPAFDQNGEVIHETFGGLTKRELFAAMAMQGWIMNHTPLGPHDHYAKIAVSMADALIDQLNQKESK
jgi:hypothetical protein